MSIRALIAAIEKYPDIDGLASSLPHTNEAASNFYNWLIKDKKVDPENILYCTDETIVERTAGTTRAALMSQLRQIVQDGRDQTEELYLFFSGHGFCFVDHKDKRPADVLVTSDFVRPDISGAACFSLDSVQTKMWAAMGPGHDYYFIDACRNPLDADQIELVDIGEKWGSSRLDRPCIFTLFSVARGQRASTSSGFVDSLLAGLRGRGRAKGWGKKKNSMVVTFDLLKHYLEEQLQGVGGGDDPDAACPGVIAQLQPPPKSRCVIQVRDAAEEDRFELRTTRGIAGPNCTISAPFRLQIDLLPDDYNFEVVDTAAPPVPVGRIDPPETEWIDLYDDCTVTFKKGIPPSSTGDTGSISVHGPVGGEIRYLDIQRGTDVQETLTTTNVSRQITPGAYKVELRQRGLVIDRRDLDIRPGRSRRIDFSRVPERGVRDNLQAINERLRPFMGEPLPAPSTRNFSLWLGLLGATHLVPDTLLVPGRAAAVVDNKLKPVERMSPGESLLYVLVESNPEATPRAVAQRNGTLTDLDLEFLPVLTRTWKGQIVMPAGPAVLSFKVPSQRSLSVMTHLLPNRVTFITITHGRADDFDVHQYLLPVYTVIEHLIRDTPPSYIQKVPLSALRIAWHGQEQFAARHKVVFTEREDAEYWLNPNHAWVDPMMTLVSTYEAIRRGALIRQADMVSAMLSALRWHFKDSADVEVIAQVAGEGTNIDFGTPLVSDGFILWHSERHNLPLPARNLSYNGAWTCWRGASEELEASVARVSEESRSSRKRARQASKKGNQESDEGGQEMEA